MTRRTCPGTNSFKHKNQNTWLATQYISHPKIPQKQPRNQRLDTGNLSNSKIKNFEWSNSYSKLASRIVELQPSRLFHRQQSLYKFDIRSMMPIKTRPPIDREHQQDKNQMDFPGSANGSSQNQYPANNLTIRMAHFDPAYQRQVGYQALKPPQLTL